MNPDECPPPEVLRAFALGNLDEGDVEGVARHLETCGSCAEVVAAWDGRADTILMELRRRVACSPGAMTQGGEETRPLVAEPDAGVIPPGQLDDFRIVREIGRGGMGIVYEAYQGALNRHVAVKLLREPADLARFRREARAAGRLHHTNIVPVHGIGEHDGRHYYVMQYIAGRGLDDVLRVRRCAVGEGRGAGAAPADFREVARIVLQVAEAVAYAHDQGIVHRDLKPSNILLDERSIAWITDFGLAFDASDTETLTQTGDLIGTLRYMAPERFAGRCDAAADIYGLGVTLYELATGRPAFSDADRASLIHHVMHLDPPPPRQVDPRVPRDLETIVLKAMARDPAHRYAGAAELAADLRRFLDDRPIRARRVGLWERGLRWCRRNRLAAGLLAGLVVVFLAGFAAVTVLWRQAHDEAARAGKLALAEADARAAERALRVRAQAEVAARDFDRASELAARGEGALGMLWMAEAMRQAPPEEPALPHLIRANLAAWEGPSPRLRAILDHGGSIDCTLFRADGRAVLTGSNDDTARLWDAETGRPIGSPLVLANPVRSFAWAPDGRGVLVGGYDGKVRTWIPGTGRLVGEPWVVSGEPVWSLDFVPGGRLLMTYGRDLIVRFWDIATRRRVGPPIRAGLADCDGPALSPDGRLLVGVDEGGRVRTWDVEAGRPVGLSPGTGPATVARFSPDGRLIATGGADGAAALWDAVGGRRLAELPRHGSRVRMIRFSPDGRRVVTVGDDAARIGETADGYPVGSPLRSSEVVLDVAFSPDGRLIATAGADGTARLWDAANGRPVGPPLRHRSIVRRVAFSPDGRLLLSAGIDGTGRLWEIAEAEAGSVAAPQSESAGAPDANPPAPEPGIDFWNARFSPDRSRVLLWNEQGSVRILDAESGQPVGPPTPQRWRKIRAAVFSPDGARIAIATHDVGFREGGSRNMTCQAWDPATGRPASPLLPHVEYVAALAFRPDGAVLATGDYTSAVHLWDPRTGARVGGPLHTGSIAVSLALSPDGRVLAVGTAEPAHQLELWDLATNRPIGEPTRFRSWVARLDFSGDGTRLAAGSNDSTVRIIEVATGRAIGEPIRLDRGFHGQAISPDGRSLLTVGWAADRTGMARLWDTRSGRPIAPPIAHPGAPTTRDGLAFSPDSRRVAIGFDDGTVRIWDAATARPIGPPRRLHGSARTVAFGRDGRSLLAVDTRGNLRTWALAEPPDEPVDRLIGRLQVASGLELDATRQIAVLEPEEWHRRRARIGDPPTPPGPEAEADWHEACARDAESIGDGLGARWHLDRLIAARPGDGLLHARRARAWLWSGDLQAADADLDRAIERGPRDRIADWLSQRAADSLADGRPADALRLLDGAIAARPGDWHAHAMRAEALAALGRPADGEAALATAVERGAGIPFLIRMAADRSRAGRWADAVPLYDRAIAMGTVPYEVWREAAIAHLELGDEPGYRRVCEILRARYPTRPPEPLVVEKLATVLTLGPGGLGDDGKAPAWIAPRPSGAAPALDDPKSGFPRLLGAVLLRAGRTAEAIGRIRGEIARGDGPATFEQAAFLAMATFQTGDSARARSLLTGLPDEGPDRPSSEAWWRVRARRLLRREATHLILDGNFPADPFAP